MAPHTNISGGVKTICTLAQMFSAYYKTTVVFNRLFDPRLRWLFNDEPYRFVATQRGSALTCAKVDCVVDFMDNVIDTGINAPHVLFMQGYGNTPTEFNNLNFPFKLIIATSQWLADVAVGRGHTNVVVIPPGIQDCFLSCGEKIFHGHVIVGSLFHKFAVKNSSAFIAAMNGIAKRTSVPMSLLLLASSIADCTPKPDLRCDWYMAPRQELLPNMYNKCTVWVSPSLREGFGLTTIEAMACGVPVVWVRSGGLDACMIDSENCLIVEPGYVRDNLGSAVLRLVADKVLAKKLSIAGQRTARQFTWERCFLKFKAALEKIF